jgi:hypothetical protein
MYRDPTAKDLDNPMFNAIWDCIKTWVINVPEEYEGYCWANGNHLCAILDAVTYAVTRLNVDQKCNNIKEV